ncbi:class II aldolase/adducin family protein [Actinophytocola sp.]|uniref:class II aldolase/adducin family protein n=1 Tax=Actinophytocola sp. TaxID=1872138 RepID=UPI002D41E5F5|nr:class II aldolase/adducin family protein [Actinophytocola sp.]HYQ64178.1 class II aldolase/adducin family protein [Actinophytocola sp.]
MDEIRGQIVAACHRLAHEGLVPGTAGNLSVRQGDLVALTATGLVMADATLADVTVVDLSGEIVEGGLRPTSEAGLHLGVHRRFGDGAIVHTHAPASTALACVLDELPVIHYQLLDLGGAVPVVPFHPFGTPELAGAVSEAMTHKNAVLMANHGAVTRGATLAEALERTFLLEWGCTLYEHASALGTPKVLTLAQQQAIIEVALTLRYGKPQPVNGDDE